MSRFSDRVTAERVSRCWTQRDVAERVGVGVPHISKIEAGLERPGDDLVARLATALGLPFDELMLLVGRIPQPIIDNMAADPERALPLLRQFATPV